MRKSSYRTPRNPRSASRRYPQAGERVTSQALDSRALEAYLEGYREGRVAIRARVRSRSWAVVMT